MSYLKAIVILIFSRGHFESQASENRPLAVSCTKNVNLIHGTPKAILLHTKQLPRTIWLDSEVFK